MLSVFRSCLAVLLCVIVSVKTAEAVTVDLKFQYRESLDSKDSLWKGVETVLNYIQAEVQANPENEDMQFALAVLYWQYDQSKAYEQLRELLKMNPKHAEGRFLLGVILYYWDKLKQARDQFSIVLQNDPKHVRAYNGLVTVLAKMTQFHEAITTMAHAQTILPQEESFYFNQAINYASLGKDYYKPAIANLETALKLNPTDGEYYYMLGLLYFEENAFELARQTLNKALELEPDNAIALLTIASSYHQEKNFEKAIELAEQALTIDPDNKDIMAELEEYLKDYRKWKEAQ